MATKFSGKHSHSIDAKGRIIVPAKFREKLGESFIVTLGIDGCLCMYPTDEWDRFVDDLQKLPGTEEARNLKRFFNANAEECEMDKQGRVLIPSELRDMVQLGKDIMSIGNMNKIEIWDKERWMSANAVTYDNVKQAAEHLANYGISF